MEPIERRMAADHWYGSHCHCHCWAQGQVLVVDTLDGRLCSLVGAAQPLFVLNLFVAAAVVADAAVAAAVEPERLEKFADTLLEMRGLDWQLLRPPG